MSGEMRVGEEASSRMADPTHAGGAGGSHCRQGRGHIVFSFCIEGRAFRAASEPVASKFQHPGFKTSASQAARYRIALIEIEIEAIGAQGMAENDGLSETTSPPRVVTAERNGAAIGSWNPVQLVGLKGELWRKSKRH